MYFDDLYVYQTVLFDLFCFANIYLLFLYEKFAKIYNMNKNMNDEIKNNNFITKDQKEYTDKLINILYKNSFTYIKFMNKCKIIVLIYFLIFFMYYIEFCKHSYGFTIDFIISYLYIGIIPSMIFYETYKCLSYVFNIIYCLKLSNTWFGFINKLKIYFYDYSIGKNRDANGLVEIAVIYTELKNNMKKLDN